MRCIFLKKDNEQMAQELTQKILGLLMKKRVNEITWNIYKPKIYHLILDYLKFNS